MKTKRQFRSCSLPLVVLVTIVFLLSISFLYVIVTLHQPKADSGKIISFPEISELLNSNWESSGIIHHESYNLLGDLIGSPSSLVMRIDEEFKNVQLRNVLLTYSVMTYSDPIAARERYDVQVNVVFLHNDIWEEYQLGENVALHADRMHAECFLAILENGDREKKCATALLYGKYIVFIGMITEKNSNVYIDGKLIEDIYAIIDNTMQEMLALDKDG